MQTKFLNDIAAENIFSTAEDKILLAISGGADSVVLAHLLKAAEVDFALAHCNFKLRGDESEGDEAFVRQLANELDVPIYITFFETEKIVAARKSSIQIVARELRYTWLAEIREKQGYDYIATAHHLNDAIESLLINLTKGCGIRGLHGILPKTESSKLIRPMLFAEKDEIVNYAKENQLSYREDSSNATLKYTRNQLRHQVIPELKSINPSLEATFAENFKNLREAEWLYDFAIDKLKTALLEYDEASGSLWAISIEKLRQIPAAKSVLYEILQAYGFTGRQVGQMIQHLEGNSGAIYYSTTHRLLRSYGKLLLEKLAPQSEDKAYQFLENLPMLGEYQLIDFEGDFSLQGCLITIEEFEQAPKNTNIAYFDADLLSLPLRIRNWNEGDSFEPLGMNGQHKKLSSLFKDAKLSIFERERMRLLMSGEDIAWVMGMRSDERFKVTDKTTRVLELVLTN
jgi:tRNA(Ile)-lysidine synthase